MILFPFATQATEPAPGASIEEPRVRNTNLVMKQIESQADVGAPTGGKSNTKGPYRGKEIGRADLTASTPPLP